MLLHSETSFVILLVRSDILPPWRKPIVFHLTGAINHMTQMQYHMTLMQFSNVSHEVNEMNMWLLATFLKSCTNSNLTKWNTFELLNLRRVDKTASCAAGFRKLHSGNHFLKMSLNQVLIQ